MKLRSKIFYTYVLFVVVFVLLTLLPSPDKATLSKYHLHASGIRLLDITLIIPLCIMWFAIFYGYCQFRRYSQHIKSNQDGKQASKLATGLFVLAIGLPLSSILSDILQLIARAHPGFTGAQIIITNYFDVLYTLIAFLYINSAARGLNRLAKSRPGFALGNIVVIAVIVIGVIFCDLIARGHAGLSQTYHLSFSQAMLTLAIPYMYIWFLGLYSIAELYAYGKRVAGVVYRKSWHFFAFGLGSIIVINILLQYLTTLTAWLKGLSLASILILLYVLLILLAGGFIVVALGARKLMKIEEV